MRSATKNSETSAYPGEYKPVQSKFEMLAHELSKPHEGASSPAANICETSEYYKIELAAPGLEREDFLIHINEHELLSISALHKESNKIEKEKYKKKTFNYECFTREFLLPDNIDSNFNKAEYNAGVLRIWFLKLKNHIKKELP